MTQSKSFFQQSRLDFVNVGLMLLCCLVAYIIPWPMLLWAYAVLGPAHYLTQLSWLHDRNYFVPQAYDTKILIIITIVLAVLLLCFDLHYHLPKMDFMFQVFLLLAILIALITVAFKSYIWRLLAIPCSIALLFIMQSYPRTLMLLFFVPTVIHVYVFTSFFILSGAIKNKSWPGFISFIVLLLCGSSFFWFIPFLPIEFVDQFVQQNKSYFFQGLAVDFIRFFNLQMNDSNFIMTIKFLAFAYTYHYLNWFSKTGIIGWHKVSMTRGVGIIVLYILAVSLYVYDYTLGFIVLGGLSLGHVILEFPLDAIVIKNLGVSLKRSIHS